MCTFQLSCDPTAALRSLPTACAHKADLAPALGDLNGVSPGPGNGIQLRDGPHAGRLLFAGHHGFTDLVWYSDTGGSSWVRSASVLRVAGLNDTQCADGAACYDEPALVEAPADTAMGANSPAAVQLHMRNDAHAPGHPRFLALSTDSGHSFGAVSTVVNLTGPPNGCQASLTRGGAGAGALYFCNPAWAGGRTQLSVRRSTDAGRTWPRCTEAQRMDDGGCAGVVTVEVNQSSYSSLTAMGTEKVGVLYERGPEWGDSGCSGVSCRISFTAVDAEF